MPYGAVLAGDVAVAVDVLTGLWATANAARSRPARPLADVQVLEGADAVALAAPQWRVLEHAGGAATGFQRLAVAQASVAAHLDRGETPRIVVVHEHGRPAVLLATVTARRAGLRVTRFLGDPLIQYGDALVADGAEPTHLETALHAAAQATDVLWLRRVRADAKLAPALAGGFPTLQVTEAPYVSLGGSSSLPRRRDVERRRRRLQDCGEVAFQTVHGLDARRTVREALALKRQWLAWRGLSSSVVGVDAWEAALQRLAASAESPLAAARLTVGGRLAAAEVALVHGDHWYAFLGAYDEAFAAAGPGNVQMSETLARCAAAGITTYDLLPPCDAYKARVACGSVPVSDHARAVTVAGRLGMLALRARPAAKAAIGRLPSGMRRAVLSARR